MKTRLRDLREDADISQKTIAEILHGSQRAYSHYEQGSRGIPLDFYKFGIILFRKIKNSHINGKSKIN